MAMTFETDELQGACEADPNILNKLTTVREDAPGYGTPGPENLNAHARHAHVYNGVGVAWVYGGTPLGADQHILALGRKDDKAKNGFSGYAWNKRGRI